MPDNQNTAAVPAAPSSELSKEDIVDIFNTEDKDELELEEKKTDGKKKEEPEKEPDEEVELEDEEDKEEKPEDLDLQFNTPVSRKKILEKYPNLFKDFPYLETAYFREKEYTELFPTLEDAREVVDKAKTLEKFEGDLANGDISTILSSVKENDKDSYFKIVDDYLPALYKADQGAYFHVIGNVMRTTIAGMVQEGKRINNDALAEAAAILNQFIFGNTEYTAPQRISKPGDNTERAKLEQERQQYAQERFETTRDDLTTRVDNTIKNTIFQHIDPRSTMTEYVKKTAVKDAMDALDTAISADTRFKAILDKLWEKAAQSNYNRNTVEEIRKAYLSKAKTLLPEIIKRTRNEAMRGQTNRREEKPRRLTSDNSGRASTNNNAPEQPKRHEKTVDYFMRD